MTTGTQQRQDWYYLDSERQKQGPFPPAEFKALADRGVIQGETLVCGEGYADSNWVSASHVAGLVASGTAAATPVPASATPPPLAAAPVSSAPARDPVPDRDLKPRKGSFIFPRMMIGALISALLTAGAMVLLVVAGIPPLLGLPVFALGLAFTYHLGGVAFRKERYELRDATVVCHRGGMMSDQTTELEIRNITHVKVKLPWLRYKFFGVGDVLVESAGNSEPMVLRAIRDPEGVYAEMRERMKRNGYDLTERELLHEEQPAIIGVLGECIGMAFVSFMLIVFGLTNIVGFADEISAMGASWVLWILGPLFVLAALAFLVVHFLDFRRRTYRVYNDVVVYEEGFLTRENAFIPYENIADAATKRSIVDQFISLYDVLISCQGSSSEIKFRRLRQGVQLSYTIDQLVLEAGRKPAPAGPVSREEATSAARQLPRRAEPELVAPGEAWIADLKMSGARVMVPLLLLIPLVPLWIAAMIQAGIKLLSTNYAVRPGSIRHSYRFLTTHDREFAYDKITGLVIRENLWDRLFGTVTLRFWSIGSGKSLELAHVRRRDLDLEAIMRQIGIPAASAPPCEVPASFGPISWLRARCLRLVYALLVVVAFAVAAMMSGEDFLFGFAAVPAVVCLVGFAYEWIYFARQRLRFHEHHVEAEQGVITRHRYYARYRNVKKNKVTRYPGGNGGALEIFVAGEQQIGQKSEKKGQAKLTKPCSFTLGFLPKALEQGELLDDILCGRVEPSPGATPAEPLELLFETPRAVGNTLFKVVLLSVLLVPLIVLLPITIPVAIIAVKRWRYRLQAGRVATTWGLLFRKQVSIVLDRVDSLQQQQGPLNKIFKNGNVSIMTAGSSKPDLVMPNAPDYQALYGEIRKLSQGG